MSTFKIVGGFPLSGTVTPIANKNSIVKLIPAAVLADGPVTIHNVPKSSSVRIMLQVFKQLGGRVAYLKDDSIRLNATDINTSAIDEELAQKERAAFVFLGPLISRFGTASIKDGGGCKLGNRPLDTMFQGLIEMGVEIDENNGYKMHTKGLHGNEKIWLIEASVTGTDTLVLAAVKAKGRTVIYNAACEPHVQDLCNFLVAMGAQIQGIGTNKLIIDGVEKLNGVEWTVQSDFLDVGGLIVTAAITGGEMTIKNAIPEHMTQILNYFKKLNLNVITNKEDIYVPAKQDLRALRNVKGDLDKIMDQPWPTAFPVDLIPQALILALNAEGSIRVFSNMFELQLLELYYELIKMKANIVMSNQHQVITLGKSNLVGTRINPTTVLQAAHALVLAGLTAQGTTTINNADIIHRRFPEIIGTLSALGARIEEI